VEEKAAVYENCKMGNAECGMIKTQYSRFQDPVPPLAEGELE